MSSQTNPADRSFRLGRILRLIFSLLFNLILWFAAYLRWLWPWMQNWGATQAEIDANLPGDDLVPDPTLRLTKGITVQAGPERIYPWLLQIGVDRGGMYSYDWLENLFGLHVRSVGQIVPELQATQVGDFWRFTPENGKFTTVPGLYVRELIPDRAVLLTFGLESKPNEEPVMTWQFILNPQPEGATRLLLRSNVRIGAVLPIKLSYFIQFIMEQKMLRSIQELAESYHPVRLEVGLAAD